MNSFRCLVLTIWYGLDPGNVFLAQLRDITKGRTPKTRISDAQFVQYVHVLCLETCRACTAVQTFSSTASNSWRIRTYAEEAATSLPTNATAGFGGCTGIFSHHSDPHALSVIYCSKLLYINYIGLILAKILRHLVEINSNGAGS